MCLTLSELTNLAQEGHTFDTGMIRNYLSLYLVFEFSVSAPLLLPMISLLCEAAEW